MGRSRRKPLPRALQELEEEGLPPGWQEFWQGRRGRVSKEIPPSSPAFQETPGMLLEALVDRPLRAEERLHLLQSASGRPSPYDPVLHALWINERTKLEMEASGEWLLLLQSERWEDIVPLAYDTFFYRYEEEESMFGVGILPEMLQKYGYKEWLSYLETLPKEKRQKLLREEMMPHLHFWKEQYLWSNNPPPDKMMKYLWQEVSQENIYSHRNYLISLLDKSSADVDRYAEDLLRMDFYQEDRDKLLQGAFRFFEGDGEETARKLFVEQLRSLLPEEADQEWDEWLEGNGTNPLLAWGPLIEAEERASQFYDFIDNANPSDWQSVSLQLFLDQLAERLDLRFYHTVSDQILDCLESYGQSKS